MTEASGEIGVVANERARLLLLMTRWQGHLSLALRDQETTTTRTMALLIRAARRPSTSVDRKMITRAETTDVGVERGISRIPHSTLILRLSMRARLLKALTRLNSRQDVVEAVPARSSLKLNSRREFRINLKTEASICL